MAKSAKKVEKELSLETVLWNCRVALRGAGTIETNRDAVIGLAFLKFCGDKFEKCRAKIIQENGNIPAFVENDAFYRCENVFYLPEGVDEKEVNGKIEKTEWSTRWNWIVANASSNDIAVKLDRAMAEIEKRNPPLKGALPQKFYATLGVSKETLKNLIDNINQIDEKRFNEQDLIGRVYEYFLQSYAAASSKDDGEFYTPACIVNLIAELIEPFDGVVYDPCCGSGGMFVQSMKFVERHNGNRNKISVVGQESNKKTWQLAKMNLAIRGIAHDLGKENASTFTNDQHKAKDKKINYIMANPPFNLKNWRGANDLADDSRWAKYGFVPRVSNANYAWIFHIMSKLDVNNGIAGFLLANGALGDMDDVQYREQVVKSDVIEAIIVLPRDMFYTTDISVTLWILNNNKKACELNGRKLRDRQGEILFVDLRTWDENVAEYKLEKGSKKKTILTDAQIQRIKEIYNNWQNADTTKYQDIPELCKSAKITDIKAPDYSLAPSNYIEFIDHDLEIDYEKEMTRIQSEMKEVMEREQKSQTMLKNAFKGIGYDID